MDVLITRSGDPYIDNGVIYVSFLAIGQTEAGELPSIRFRVQYGWGATAQQRQAAILNAATAAKQAYETAHGVTLPNVNRLEILL